MNDRRDTWILTGLAAAATTLAVVMALQGKASWLEAASFVTGALCVWLTVKENIWNFPLGLVNVATFCVVFVRAGLYADAGLQVVYFVLGLMGWYLWLYGGARRTALRVNRVGRVELGAVIAAGVVITIALRELLERLGGAAPFWDALTTAISLSAQWLLNRKRLENWLAWIVVDIIYVPLYLSKELYLTAGLYAVFLVMATMGWLHWRGLWQAQAGTSAKSERIEAEIAT
jgi:nicotinamide mononucleotide transporter